MFSYNVDLILIDFGLLDINPSSEAYVEFTANVSGWIQFLQSDIHNFIFVKGNIEDYDRLYYEKDDKARSKYYYQTLEAGTFEVHRIFYTEKHEKFYKSLSSFASNPFLPEDVQVLAKQIGRDLQENIHVILRLLLKKLVLEYWSASNQKSNSINVVLLEEFRHQTLYRTFEEERIKHDETLLGLKKLIRLPLNIDEKW